MPQKAIFTPQSFRSRHLAQSLFLLVTKHDRISPAAILFPLRYRLAKFPARGCWQLPANRKYETVRAQKSPHAGVLLDYEKALTNDGIEAASKYMTPERLASMREMLKQFGPESFKEFQDKMRASAPKGKARRKQIETVTINGDLAVLEARTDPNVVDEILFLRTQEGCKIDKGRL